MGITTYMEPSHARDIVLAETNNQRSITHRERNVPVMRSTSESRSFAKDVVAVANTPMGNVNP